MWEAIDLGIGWRGRSTGEMRLERIEHRAGSDAGMRVTMRSHTVGARTVEVMFGKVMGYTLMEDAFGPNGGQVTREGEGTEPFSPRSPLSRSFSSATMAHIRSTARGHAVEILHDHAHFALALRGFHLSVVAHRDPLITRGPTPPD